jgi:tetratricopeptide (TPR) repeat protein
VRQDQSDGAAIKGEKDCSAKASMQKNNLSESSSFRDIIKSDEAAELEMASRSALTKDQLLEKVGILAAKYQEDPNNLNVVKDLAATYEQLEDWASAQQFFDWAHQVSGGDVALRSKAEAMGDKSKALGIADLEAQAAADPDNADLQSQLVEIKAGRLDERLVECKQRVDQNPTDPKLRYELGYAFYDAGKHSEAIPHLQQATRNPHIRTKVLLLLGRTFYAKGMVDLAIKQLSDANAELIAMDSTKKEILFELGVIYHDADRKDEGLECFKQIYEIDYGYRDVAARVEGSYQG